MFYRIGKWTGFPMRKNKKNNDKAVFMSQTFAIIKQLFVIFCESTIDLLCNVSTKMENALFSFLFLLSFRNQVSISSTFFTQHLCARSQKCKNSVKLFVFFMHLGFLRVKGVRKRLMKLTPGLSTFKLEKLFIF